MKYILLVIWLCHLCFFSAEAQDRLSGHFLPRLLVNGNFSQRLHWTVSAEPDLIWLRRTEGFPAETSFHPFILNGEAGLDYQWSGAVNVAAGYLIGWRNLDSDRTDLEHRLLQQLTLTRTVTKFRLRWRFRTEQRFFRQNDFRPIHRFRSRLGVDFPLQGERLDPGEPYLHANAEGLINPENPQPLRFSERRIYGGVGWRLRSGIRLENGIEWRHRLDNSRGDHRQILQWRLTVTI